jgi:hypothetical protein
MSMTRFLVAVGFTLSLMLFASPASAKKLLWYTARSCLFYPGGGHRTLAETAACRREMAVAGEVLRFCRDQTRRGPLPCGPNQDTVWRVVR